MVVVAFRQTTILKDRCIMYKYIPNDFAKKKFGLTEKEYSCGSLTVLFENTLGQENFNKFMVSQDPFQNKRTKRAEIRIIINPDELAHHQYPQTRLIGVVEKS